jgi:hypothetical protein
MRRGFFAPDGQWEGVAIMLPKAFAILFALAGVTCWLRRALSAERY